MRTKEEAMQILSANNARGLEPNEWIVSALNILNTHDFSDYRDVIEKLSWKVGSIKDRDPVNLAIKQRAIRAQLWAYEFLTTR